MRPTGSLPVPTGAPRSTVALRPRSRLTQRGRPDGINPSTERQPPLRSMSETATPPQRAPEVQRCCWSAAGRSNRGAWWLHLAGQLASEPGVPGGVGLGGGPVADVAAHDVVEGAAPAEPERGRLRRPRLPCEDCRAPLLRLPRRRTPMNATGSAGPQRSPHLGQRARADGGRPGRLPWHAVRSPAGGRVAPGRADACRTVGGRARGRRLRAAAAAVRCDGRTRRAGHRRRLADRQRLVPRPRRRPPAGDGVDPRRGLRLRLVRRSPLRRRRPGP